MGKGGPGFRGDGLSGLGFNRTERQKRHSLGLGQAFDSSDIEPLVGPVPAQGLQMLAGVQVPEHNSPIIAAACQLRPVRAAPEGLNRALMSFAH